MTTQGDLFGAPAFDAADTRELRAEARRTYHETTDPESPGCCDCVHGDWKHERCRLAGRPVDIDFGMCECWTAIRGKEGT